MIDVLDEYDVVTVGDFYDLVDMDSVYTDRDWGWDNLGGAYVDRVRDGYIIRLPRVIPLRQVLKMNVETTREEPRLKICDICGNAFPKEVMTTTNMWWRPANKRMEFRLCPDCYEDQLEMENERG